MKNGITVFVIVFAVNSHFNKILLCTKPLDKMRVIRDTDPMLFKYVHINLATRSLYSVPWKASEKTAFSSCHLNK